MAEHVLITGGAGFIGSHLGDELLRAGYRVRALDSLVEQVHGDAKRPDYLTDEIELIAGDVRNPEVVRGALEGVDSVVHLAARVGVGQSMYQLAEYTAANTAGTGVLLEALLDHPVRKLVVASSMSIYGEGAYEPAPPTERTRAADVTLAREALGFEAEVQLEDGMAELAEWLEAQHATDRFEEAAEELTQRGLTR